MMSLFLTHRQMDPWEDLSSIAELDYSDDFEEVQRRYLSTQHFDESPPWSIVNESNRKRAREYNEKFYEKSPESDFEVDPMQQEAEDSDAHLRRFVSIRRSSRRDLLDRLPDERLELLENLQWEGVDTVLWPETRDRMVEEFNAQQDNFEIFHSKYGYGLRALKPISEGKIVGPYEGVRVPKAVADALPNEYDKVVPLNNSVSIVGDVIPYGKPLNYTAFANDPGFSSGIGLSRGPQTTSYWPNVANVAVRPWVDMATGESGANMYALRDIKPGDEITYAYGYGYWSEHGVGGDNYWPTAELKISAYNQWVRDMHNAGLEIDIPPPPEIEERKKASGKTDRRKGKAPVKRNV